MQRPIKTVSSPPYLLGLLGFIPLIGFFVGLGLTLYGILKFKDKKLTIIGVCCMIFTVVIYSSIFYIFFKSDFGKKGWETHAQMQLNSLIKHVEFYKLENGQYPDSLQQLKNENEFIFITDPTKSSQNIKDDYYSYKNLGNHYLLYSTGTDAIPNTNDDIYPAVQKNQNIGWIKSE